MTEQALKAVEAALDQKALAQLMVDAARWRWLRERCGNLQDGSQQTVTLYQDDATQSAFIRVDNRSFGGSAGTTLESLIDAQIAMLEQENDHKPFMTTSQGMAGWFAVHLWWNPEGFWEPWSTGFGRYATKGEAEVEAKQMADAEGIDYRP